MILKGRNPAATEPLSDAIVSVAASLQEARSGEEVLNLLTRGLSDRGIGCALFVQADDATDLTLERATLPFAPNVWGRPLRLPRISAVINRRGPVLQPDLGASFSETTAEGTLRSLLSSPVEGSLATAPLRFHGGRAAVLCLASQELSGKDVSAAWSLALQLGSALREAQMAAGIPKATSPADASPPSELSLFQDLTRRLSYSLNAKEAVDAGLEVLAPAMGFQLAAAVVHGDGGDATSVYASPGVPEQVASRAAADALDAFIRLTGGKHRSCSRPPFETMELGLGDLASGQDGKLSSALDAPLVTEGDVIGLLRISAAQAEAFDEVKKRTFFTVASLISLALERVSIQQQAERAQLASLAESLSDGLILVDADLRVTSYNSTAKKLLASRPEGTLVERAALSGATLTELAREALSSRKPTMLRELPGGEGTGGRQYLVAMAAPLAGSTEGSAAVVIVRDVTEEKLMQERLLQSEKMVSVGQLVSGVAHELNNPLTGIMGFAQLLLARSPDEKATSQINTILSEADRAAKIVQNLLSFARRKRAEKEPANLNVLLERVLELRSYDLRIKSIEVNLDLDPTLPETMVDADQIQQVFFNLIVNAEQAMHSDTEQGTLLVRSRREGEIIRLSFQDTGAGMSDETLRRIFDPFFTTKETGEGTGLGLTICYGIIDEHGGRIRAESRPGRGSTFIIELPIVHGSGLPAAPAEAEPEATVTGRSILVVDDEESIQRLLGGILQLDGHQVDIASNGKEALERISQRRYDMIISDIKMPVMDGRELYQRLLDRDPALAGRIIFITGDTVSPDTHAFLERVDNPRLAKPFRVREVRDTIAEMLGDGA